MMLQDMDTRTIQEEAKKDTLENWYREMCGQLSLNNYLHKRDK